MSQPLNVFLAGIIQGSLPDSIHAQDYRKAIGALIEKHLPDAEMYDPFANHPDSLRYDPERGRDVFFELMDRAGESDVLIAFIPEASMGTAIEMWNAFHTGAVIISVSKLTENWAVRFLSDAIVPDVAELEAFIASGKLAKLVKSKISYE